MRRAVLIYAVLLASALGGAYYTWTHEVGPDRGDAIVLLPGSPDELESIVYASETIELTITMKEDDLGRFAWVRAVPREGAKSQTEVDPTDPADPADPAEPHAPPADDGEPEEFKAGPAGDSIIEGLAPFAVKRVLEGIGDEELADLGLNEPEATLTIARRGRAPKSYQLGGNVFGGSNVYVRDAETGKIYVADAKLIRPLQTGKRTLPDRNLIGYEIKQIKTLTLRTPEASAAFAQNNPDDPQAVYWSNVGETSANPSAAAWVDKVLRLRASKYVQPGNEPTGLEEVYSYAVHGTDRKTTTVAIYRTWGADGEDEWYARSEHTRGLVKLHRSLAAETAVDLATALEGAAPADGG
jgi:hypothetical protein